MRTVVCLPEAAAECTVVMTSMRWINTQANSHHRCLGIEKVWSRLLGRLFALIFPFYQWLSHRLLVIRDVFFPDPPVPF